MNERFCIPLSPQLRLESSRVDAAHLTQLEREEQDRRTGGDVSNARGFDQILPARPDRPR